MSTNDVGVLQKKGQKGNRTSRITQPCMSLRLYLKLLTLILERKNKHTI